MHEYAASDTRFSTVPVFAGQRPPSILNLPCQIPETCLVSYWKSLGIHCDVSLASLISQLVLLLFHSASIVYTCMHVVAV